MITFLIRRAFQGILFTFLASLLVYTALVMLVSYGRTPRSAAAIYAAAQREAAEDPEDAEDIMEHVSDIEERYELDKPYPLNFLAWLFDPADTEEVTTHFNQDSGEFDVVPKGIDIQLGGLRLRGSGALTGDFGESDFYAYPQKVGGLVGERWGFTWPLLVSSLIIALVIGIPLGVFSASKQHSRLDHFVTFVSFSGLSVPPFVLGLILIILLSILPNNLRLVNGWTWLPILPPGGLGEPDNFMDRMRHMMLPGLTLAIPQIAIVSRYARFSMLDVLRQDYIRTAWAKGLSGSRVILKHALRNVLIPIITIIGMLTPTLITGSVIVETVFSYHGMGHLYYRSLGGCLATIGLLAQDPPPCPRVGYYPIDTALALALTVIVIAVVVSANILADLLYVAADPRVNYKSQSPG